MKKVLIVEDEPLIAQDIKACLQREDYIVVGIAGSSSRALDLLNSQKPDAVILDININGSLDGIEIAKYVNAKYKLPFIFLTSYSDKDTLGRAKLTMPYGYIVKPFDANDLRTALEVALFNFENSQSKSETLNLEALKEKYKCQISEREYEIILCMYEGLNNGQMAQKYFISENTVKSHIKRIYSKLNIHSRQDVVKAMTR